MTDRKITETERRYTTGIGALVPLPRYLCTSRAKEIIREGRTHLCKLHVDHDGDQHQCICGKGWEKESA